MMKIFQVVHNGFSLDTQNFLMHIKIELVQYKNMAADH